MISYPLSTRPPASPPADRWQTRRLRLLPSGDGWSLVAADGALVFSALGSTGRRRCIEFARAAGVLALNS